jgi:hypothetical protein
MKQSKPRSGQIRRERKRARLEALLLAFDPPVLDAQSDFDGTIAEIQLSVQCVPPQSNDCATSSGAGVVDWTAMPAACHMLYNAKTKTASARRARKGDANRILRKQQQCDAFASALRAINLPDGAVVVDFGCGSCGVTLPLAFAFPKLMFIGVDNKKTALDLMRERAQHAGLSNIQVCCSSIADFNDPFDCVIALHACGPASDEAIVHAVQMNTPYIVSPCCIGKVKFSMGSSTGKKGSVELVYDAQQGSLTQVKDGQKAAAAEAVKAAVEEVTVAGAEEVKATDKANLNYPRSKWLVGQLRGYLPPPPPSQEKKQIWSTIYDTYAELAAAADASEEAPPPTPSAESTAVVSTNGEKAEVGETGGGATGTKQVENVGESTGLVATEQRGSRVINAPSVQLLHRTEALHTRPNAGGTVEGWTLHEVHRMCNSVVGTDRNQWAVETAAYTARMCTMPGLAASAKSAVLIGWPPRASSMPSA